MRTNGHYYNLYILDRISGGSGSLNGWQLSMRPLPRLLTRPPPQSSQSVALWRNASWNIARRIFAPICSLASESVGSDTWMKLISIQAVCQDNAAISYRRGTATCPIWSTRVAIERAQCRVASRSRKSFPWTKASCQRSKRSTRSQRTSSTLTSRPCPWIHVLIKMWLMELLRSPFSFKLCPDSQRRHLRLCPETRPRPQHQCYWSTSHKLKRLMKPAITRKWLKSLVASNQRYQQKMNTRKRPNI